MTIGNEIPFRRSLRSRDTGSLVLDQARKAAHEKTDAGEATHERREGPR